MNSFDPYDKDGLPRKGFTNAQWAPNQNQNDGGYPHAGMTNSQWAPNYPAAPQQGNAYAPVPASSKNKIVALLLAFFLGGFGIHNFYLGNTFRGIGQIALLIACLIPVIDFIAIPVLTLWVIIEMILIVVGSGDYNTKKPR